MIVVLVMVVAGAFIYIINKFGNRIKSYMPVNMNENEGDNERENK